MEWWEEEMAGQAGSWALREGEGEARGIAGGLPPLFAPPRLTLANVLFARPLGRLVFCLHTASLLSLRHVADRRSKPHET
jgi:hypothetical protein